LIGLALQGGGFSASEDELAETALDIFVVQDLEDFLQQEACMPLNMHPPDSLEAGAWDACK
jgi:hypothetical protein